ncbi:DUF4430 domain-containing protein [Streptococcus caprae]|uniref:DUF4430 domain-containing protein n=1 Tax=Streptococcus caprae TaxID=1640501 RepID=A0ABV8CW47_9STRE
MKKYLTSLIVFLSALFLVACGNSTASKDEGQVNLVVTLDTNKVDETVDFDEGDTVMDVLKDNYDVTEKDGFITAIDGVSQDESKGLYWMFDVNGEMAPKAADQIEVKDGDVIEFYQEVYK